MTSESRVLSPWCWDHIERFEATLSQVTPCPTTSPSQCRKRNGWLQSPSSPDVAGWWPLLSVDTNVPFLLWLLIAFPLFLASLEVHWLPTLVWHQGAIPFLLCRQCTVGGGKCWKQLKGKISPQPQPQASFCVKVLQQNPGFDLNLHHQGSYGKENMAQFNCLQRMGLTSCNLYLRKQTYTASVLWTIMQHKHCARDVNITTSLVYSAAQIATC